MSDPQHMEVAEIGGIDPTPNQTGGHTGEVIEANRQTVVAHGGRGQPLAIPPLPLPAVAPRGPPHEFRVSTPSSASSWPRTSNAPYDRRRPSPRQELWAVAHEIRDELRQEQEQIRSEYQYVIQESAAQREIHLNREHMLHAATAELHQQRQHITAEATIFVAHRGAVMQEIAAEVDRAKSELGQERASLVAQAASAQGAYALAEAAAASAQELAQGRMFRAELVAEEAARDRSHDHARLEGLRAEMAHELGSHALQAIAAATTAEEQARIAAEARLTEELRLRDEAEQQWAQRFRSELAAEAVVAERRVSDEMEARQRELRAELNAASAVQQGRTRHLADQATTGQVAELRTEFQAQQQMFTTTLTEMRSENAALRAGLEEQRAQLQAWADWETYDQPYDDQQYDDQPYDDQPYDDQHDGLQRGGQDRGIEHDRERRDGHERPGPCPQTTSVPEPPGMAALRETVTMLAASVGDLATMAKTSTATNSELLAVLGEQASESRLRIAAEKPIITAESTETLRDELKRFKVVLNEAKCHQRSRWFRAARAIVKGRAAETLDNFITSDLGGEEKYGQALLKPTDPSWDSLWDRFEAKLKQAAGLDDASELNDAIREYSKVRLETNATIEQVEEFLNKYIKARTPMLKQGLLSATDPVLTAREIEYFKEKIAGSKVAEYLNDLPDFPRAIDTTDPEQFNNTVVGRIRQWIRPRRRQLGQHPQAADPVRGSMLNMTDGVSKDDNSTNKKAMPELKGLQKDLKSVASALLAFDEKRLGAVRDIGQKGGEKGGQPLGKGASSSVPPPGLPGVGTCSRCNGKHPECSTCPNSTATTEGFDVSQLAKSETRCDYRHRGAEPCGGRGHLRQHHHRTPGADPRPPRKGKQGDGKGKSKKGGNMLELKTGAEQNSHAASYYGGDLSFHDNHAAPGSAPDVAQQQLLQLLTLSSSSGGPCRGKERLVGLDMSTDHCSVDRSCKSEGTTEQVYHDKINPELPFFDFEHVAGCEPGVQYDQFAGQDAGITTVVVRGLRDSGDERRALHAVADRGLCAHCTSMDGSMLAVLFRTQSQALRAHRRWHERCRDGIEAILWPSRSWRCLPHDTTTTGSNDSKRGTKRRQSAIAQLDTSASHETDYTHRRNKAYRSDILCLSLGRGPRGERGEGAVVTWLRRMRRAFTAVLPQVLFGLFVLVCLGLVICFAQIPEAALPWSGWILLGAQHCMADSLRQRAEGGHRHGHRVLALRLGGGYNCRGFVWCGPARTEAVFDTGACRNAISKAFLEALLKDERTAHAVQDIVETEPITCTGMSEGMHVKSTKLAILHVTAKESGLSSQTKFQVGAVVVLGLTEDLIIGKPTLDRLGFVSDKTTIEFRCFGLRFPTILPEESADGREEQLRMTTHEYFTTSPGQSRIQSVEFCILGRPSRGQWWVGPGPGLPEELQVIEGPLHVRDGRARVDFLVHGNVHAGPGDRFVEVRPGTSQDNHLLDALSRAEAQRDAAQAQLRDCYVDAGVELAKEQCDEVRVPKDVQLLAASYKTRGKKQRQELLYPQLKEEVKQAREALQRGVEHPDQEAETYKDECVKAAEGHVGAHLPLAHRRSFLSRVIRAFSVVFWMAGCQPPRVEGFEVDLKLKSDAQPRVFQPFPLSDFDQLRLELHEDMEVAQGKARWAESGEWSAWGSPSFVVDQDGKGLLGRPVRDYRWFNSQSEDVAWPSPSAERVLQRAQRSALLSTLDCIWGFTQCSVSERTSDLLALVTRRGMLKPLVLYFGPKQGPGVFQSLMDTTFGGLRDESGDGFHSIFMDDVTIMTEAWDEDTDDAVFERHVKHCELFLQRAAARKIQFKLEKCRWAQLRVKLLGFIVGNGERRVDPAKVEGLRRWPDPSSLDDLVSFRAYANYLREYIPNYSALDAALRPYGKKGARFDEYLKDPEAREAFASLRAGLCEDAALHAADYAAAADANSGRPLELYVDASDFAWGCTLAQRPARGRAPRPIAVYSRSLSPTESAWSAFERELFGMREALAATAHLHKGFPLLVLMDHKNNLFTSSLLGGKRINNKLLRWSLDIEEMGQLVTRRWIKGADNVLGDGPSRNPHDRDRSRCLPVPTGPVRRIVEMMFKDPAGLDSEMELFLDNLNPDERPAAEQTVLGHDKTSSPQSPSITSTNNNATINEQPVNNNTVIDIDAGTTNDATADGISGIAQGNGADHRGAVAESGSASGSGQLQPDAEETRESLASSRLPAERKGIQSPTEQAARRPMPAESVSRDSRELQPGGSLQLSSRSEGSYISWPRSLSCEASSQLPAGAWPWSEHVPTGPGVPVVAQGTAGAPPAPPADGGAGPQAASGSSSSINLVQMRRQPVGGLLAVGEGEESDAASDFEPARRQDKRVCTILNGLVSERDEEDAVIPVAFSPTELDGTFPRRTLVQFLPSSYGGSSGSSSSMTPPCPSSRLFEGDAPGVAPDSIEDARGLAEVGVLPRRLTHVHDDRG